MSKLHCFDIIVENLKLLRAFETLMNPEDKCCLHFQLFSFGVELLSDEINKNEENSKKRNETAVVGKSCLFSLEMTQLLDDLQIQFLTLYLVKSGNFNEILGSCKISLASAGIYFKTELDKESTNENLQYAAGGNAKLINETTEECIAEMRLFYRFWIIKDSLITFLKSRNDQQLNIKSVQNRLLSGETDHRVVKTSSETQTVEIGETPEKKVSLKKDKLEDQNNDEITDDNFLKNEQSQPQQMDMLKYVKNMSSKDLKRFPLLQELSLELSRIEILFSSKNNVKTEIMPTITLQNIEKLAAHETRQKRHERCTSAYANLHQGISHNLYSRIYSAKVPGYGTTKTFVQKLAYLPLYANFYSAEPKIVTRFQPRNLPLHKDISRSNESVQVGDLDFLPKFKDVAITAEFLEKSTIATQTMELEREKPYSDSRNKNSIRKMKRRQQENRRKKSSLHLSRISTPNYRYTEDFNYSSDISSEIETTSENDEHQIRRQKSSSSISKRLKSSNEQLAKVDSEIEISEISSTNSNSSNVTDSLLQTLQSLRSNLKTIAANEKVKLSSSKSSSRKSSKVNSSSELAETVKTAEDSSIRPSVKNTKVNSLKTAAYAKRKSSSESTDNTESVSDISEKSSNNTVKPAPEGIQRIAEKNLMAKLTKIEVPESRRNSAHLPNEHHVDTGQLSPVSRYLNEQRYKAAMKEEQGNISTLRRRSTVRTESVSSYMPTDLDSA